MGSSPQRHRAHSSPRQVPAWAGPSWVLFPRAFTQLAASSSLRSQIKCYLLGKASLAIVAKATPLAMVLSKHPLLISSERPLDFAVISLVMCLLTAFLQ